ncbi:MAG: hypothetical protein B9S38_15630 [Verrucomicrobiia bacterium Tous-C4TDCM]|nr:MAG: hypothetical protein B9S38_15630 [Verrucomicrobiae bacterium Tous-C4TDCM]
MRAKISCPTYKRSPSASPSASAPPILSAATRIPTSRPPNRCRWPRSRLTRPTPPPPRPPLPISSRVSR